MARIRERAEGDTSPEALGALGVTYLVSGDAAAAVKALESASAQKPDDARLLSDLAAAYLVRAKQADEPADIPKALEAAERAIVLPDAPPEAYFNRALALEGLHLVDAARKAWQDYLDRDSSSAWADEARQHLEALPKVRRSSVEEDKARVRAALEEWPGGDRSSGRRVSVARSATTSRTSCSPPGPTPTSSATPMRASTASAHACSAMRCFARPATPCPGTRLVLSLALADGRCREIRCARKPSATRPSAKPSVSTIVQEPCVLAVPRRRP